MVATLDGKAWKSVTADLGGLSSVVWTGTQFFAFGFWATAVSENGLDWTTKFWDSDSRVWQTNAGGSINGRLFALGIDSMLVSQDGATWRADTTACHVSENAAFASGGQTAIIVKPFMFCLSTDSGKTWNYQTYILNKQNEGVFFLTGAWDGRKFVLGTTEGAVSSMDGVSWDVERKDGISSDLLAGDTTAMVSIGSGIVEFRGPDGVWSRVDSSGFWNSIKSVQKSPWGFLAVGKVGTWASSPDGKTWAKHENSGNYRDVGVLNGRFLAVGDSGLMTLSRDGLEWTAIASPKKLDLRSVAVGGGTMIVVGDSGLVLHQSDTSTWVAVESGVRTSFSAVAWDGNRFLAIGDSGVVANSSEGRIWASQKISGAGSLNQIAVAGAHLIVLDGSGAVWKQGPSSTWAKIRLPAGEGFVVLAGSPNSGFLAFDKLNMVWSSLDGETWTRADIGGNVFMSTVSKVVRLREQWFAIQDDGRVYSSTDGANWVGRSVESKLRSLTSDGTLLVGVGENGFIVTTPEIVVPTSAKRVPANVRRLNAWIRGAEIFLKPRVSGFVTVSARDLGGKLLFAESRVVTSGEVVSFPAPVSKGSAMVLGVRLGYTTESVVLRSLGANR